VIPLIELVEIEGSRQARPPDCPLIELVEIEGSRQAQPVRWWPAPATGAFLTRQGSLRDR
jgi:hypothetical protein